MHEKVNSTTSYRSDSVHSKATEE